MRAPLRLSANQYAARLTAAALLAALAAWLPPLPGSIPQARADERPLEQDDFERHIAPLFIRNCLGCHNASEPSGGLDLSSRPQLLAGGDSGPVIVEGQPGQSYLVQRVAAGEMPPEEKGKRLTDQEVTLLSRWVEAGAAWPANRLLRSYELGTDRRAGLDWWSLAPPERPGVPPPCAGFRIENPLDAFIGRELALAGLPQAPEADRATLIRRAKLDLLGLPPTPEEIGAFVSDPAPDAYERLVDRLLASPHYGERWGRHWLDVVRFGESDGYETNKPRPNAWPYRDYVIRAFNQDKPYTDFVLEQLAGDQVGADAATGFMVGGAHDVVGNQTVEGMLQQRVDDLNDIVGTTATAFLGLTVQCARCHDHKFDPVGQHDYYALQAVFAGVSHGERAVRPDDYLERREREPEIRRELAAIERRLAQFEPLADPATAGPETLRRPPVHHLGNIERFSPASARFVRFTVLATNQSEPCLDELEVFTAEASPRNVALAAAGGRATASSIYANGQSPIHQLAHVNDGLYGNSHSWISSEAGSGWVQIEFSQVYEIERIQWARDRDGVFADRLPTDYKIEVAVEPDSWRTVATSADRRAYVAGAHRQTAVDAGGQREPEIKALEVRRDELAGKLPSAGTMVYAGTFGQPEPTHLLYRGDPMMPKQLLPPGAVAAAGKPLVLDADAPEAERRLALARWIADPANPLTARVLVNRLWHYHFGRGLVATPSNFGFHGGRPTHPELLDWLACEFMANGWRMKPLHRLIMLSATYRQSSQANEACLAVDSDNRWLWRFAPRRLEAEPIRDSILAVSGMLDPAMGGPGYDAFEPNTNYVHVYRPKTSFGRAEWRRMVYQQKPRMQQDSTFGEFDCPDASQAAPRPNVSTTALQALNLLNSSFVVEQAGLFAARLEAEAGGRPEDQVRRGFWLALGRPCDGDELAASTALVREHGLAAFCRVLFNSNEFVYVE